MCLYPRFIKNKRYTETKKNGGVIPAVPDSRVLYLPIDCENCYECRRAKARDWNVRLQEDIKHNLGAKFVTFTFSNESIKAIQSYIMQDPNKWGLKGFELDNQIATTAMRLFNERYRRKYKKALRHWTITELGHQGTENIHLHGIIWPKCDLDEIEKIWKYGWVWKYKIIKGIKYNYVNARTINYITKYVTKRDELYKHYKPVILSSPGIGSNYTKSTQSQMNKFNPYNTKQYYISATGHKISLPKYWKQKLYTDEEREELWLQFMDKKEEYVWGEKVSVKHGKNELFKLRDFYRKKNRRLGYGSYHKDEDRLAWEENRRAEKFMLRIQNAENKKYMPSATPSAGG